MKMKKNVKVIHKMLGEGEMKSFDSSSGIVVVSFKTASINLKIPDSFMDGLVRFDDFQMQAMVLELLGTNHKPANKGKEIIENERQYKQKTNTRTKENVVDAIIYYMRSSHVVNNPYDWNEKLQRSCDTCYFLKNETCNGIRNSQTCSEYKPIPNITKAERFLWPKS